MLENQRFLITESQDIYFEKLFLIYIFLDSILWDLLSVNLTGWLHDEFDRLVPCHNFFIIRLPVLNISLVDIIALRGKLIRSELGSSMAINLDVISLQNLHHQRH